MLESINYLIKDNEEFLISYDGMLVKEGLRLFESCCFIIKDKGDKICVVKIKITNTLSKSYYQLKNRQEIEDVLKKLGLLIIKIQLEDGKLKFYTNQESDTIAQDFDFEYTFSKQNSEKTLDKEIKKLEKELSTQQKKSIGFRT